MSELGSSQAGHQSSAPRGWEASLELPKGHVAKWRVWECRRDALSQLEFGVAPCAKGGDAEPLGNPRASGMCVKNHRGEAGAILVTSVGCVVDRPLHDLVVRKVLS